MWVDSAVILTNPAPCSDRKISLTFELTWSAWTFGSYVYRTEEVCFVHPLPQRDIEMVVEHKESVARLERNDQ